MKRRLEEELKGIYTDLEGRAKKAISRKEDIIWGRCVEAFERVGKRALEVRQFESAHCVISSLMGIALEGIKEKVEFVAEKVVSALGTLGEIAAKIDSGMTSGNDYFISRVVDFIYRICEEAATNGLGLLILTRGINEMGAIGMHTTRKEELKEPTELILDKIANTIEMAAKRQLVESVRDGITSILVIRGTPFARDKDMLTKTNKILILIGAMIMKHFPESEKRTSLLEEIGRGVVSWFYDKNGVPVRDKEYYLTTYQRRFEIAANEYPQYKEEIRKLEKFIN